MICQPTLAEVVLLMQTTYFPKNKEITSSDSHLCHLPSILASVQLHLHALWGLVMRFVSVGVEIITGEES